MKPPFCFSLLSLWLLALSLLWFLPSSHSDSEMNCQSNALLMKDLITLQHVYVPRAYLRPSAGHGGKPLPKSCLNPMWRLLAIVLHCLGLCHGTWGQSLQRGTPMGLKSSKQRWSKFLFCSPGFLKVWFTDHIHRRHLEVFGEKCRFLGPLQMASKSLCGWGSKKAYILNKLFR